MQSEVITINPVFVAAHELKAPLALMRQLALNLDPTDPEMTKNCQQKLISVSERTLKQMNDLSKLARLDDAMFEMEPVAVRGICEEVVAELKLLFSSEAKSLNLKYTNKNRLVVANRDLLHSIIYNFCINALRYSEPSSVSNLLVVGNKDKVKISVRDFGPALPSDIYQKITEGNLSSPAKISFRPDSSGLGLFIATKFARYMKADVGAIRHRDGTSFFVELPVSRQGELF